MPRYTLAQRSNFLPLTARLYPYWRACSLSLLTGKPFLLAREAELFRALCRPKAGELWLDAGTSSGFYAGVLARLGCRVEAIDISPAMLRVAAQRERSPLIHWRLADAERLPAPPSTFDGVTVGATLNETARPPLFLRQLERVLRPEGTLWLMFACAEGRGRLGGLFFPDLAWVEAQLAGCALRAAVKVGPVQFAQFRKKGAKRADALG